jgi:hypothetical protein
VSKNHLLSTPENDNKLLAKSDFLN